MLNIPVPLRTYLDSLPKRALLPGWLRVDGDGRLMEFGGPLDQFGIGPLTVGDRVEEKAMFLVGSLPLAGAHLVLSAVQTGPDLFADVHLVGGEEGDWVLLLDVTAGVQVQQALQQKANEVQLLRERENRILSRMQRDLNAAARVQRSLLPSELPDAGRSAVRVAWAFHPCDELAGDLLNVVPLDDRQVAVYLADVSGHGVPAALLAVTLSRTLMPHGDGSVIVKGTLGAGLNAVPPVEVAAELNRRFPMEVGGGHYFTLLYGIWDALTRDFTYVSAGHPGPVVISRGAAQVTEESGFPIGVVADGDFEQHVIHLDRGERLYLYSDGVCEAMGHNGELFGIPRLLRELEVSAKLPLKRSVQLLMESVVRWSDGRPKDDVSLLALEATGGATALPSRMRSKPTP